MFLNIFQLLVCTRHLLCASRRPAGAAGTPGGTFCGSLSTRNPKNRRPAAGPQFPRPIRPEPPGRAVVWAGCPWPAPQRGAAQGGHCAGHIHKVYCQHLATFGVIGLSAGQPEAGLPAASSGLRTKRYAFDSQSKAPFEVFTQVTRTSRRDFFSKHE